MTFCIFVIIIMITIGFVNFKQHTLLNLRQKALILFKFDIKKRECLIEKFTLKIAIALQDSEILLYSTYLYHINSQTFQYS